MGRPLRWDVSLKVFESDPANGMKKNVHLRRSGIYYLFGGFLCARGASVRRTFQYGFDAFRGAPKPGATEAY